MKIVPLNWILLLFFGASVFFGCSEDELQPVQLSNDYLIFGEHDSECWGEGCTRIFALTRENLYYDKNRSWDLSNTNFEKVDDEIFAQVKDLLDEFPEELLQENEEFIYCNGQCDFGWSIIQYSKDGNVKSWKIGFDTPEYLSEFIARMYEKMLLIPH